MCVCVSGGGGGGGTSWLFTKRGLGFENGATGKQIQERDLDPGPPDYKSGALTTRSPHLPIKDLLKCNHQQMITEHNLTLQECPLSLTPWHTKPAIYN